MDNNGLTALIYAAQNNHSNIVMLLMNREGGMLDKTGSTTLMKAAERGNLDVVLQLLD